MRHFLALLLIGLGAAAHADRLITIPRGSKYVFRTIRAELLVEPTRPATSLGYLGIGIGKSFDAEIRREQRTGQPGTTGLDMAFNLNAPIPDLAPGISFGVLDILDETHERLRGYMAITLRQTPTGDYEGFHEFEFTFGAFFGRRNAGFIGVMLPFSDTFHVMAEHNGDQISVGADFLGPKGINFRLVVREHETLLGVSTTTRF